MALREERRDDVPILVATGDLDFHNRDTLAAAVASLDAQPRLVDLSEVTFIDSSALSVLLRLANEHHLRVVAASEHVQRLLDRTGTTSILQPHLATPAGGDDDPAVAPTQEALQEAVALMTSAVGPVEELDELVHRALDEIPAPDLVAGLVALGRALSYTAARMSLVIDQDLTNQEAVDISEAMARPAALSVLQIYGAKVAAE